MWEDKITYQGYRVQACIISYMHEHDPKYDTIRYGTYENLQSVSLSVESLSLTL